MRQNEDHLDQPDEGTSLEKLHSAYRTLDTSSNHYFRRALYVYLLSVAAIEIAGLVFFMKSDSYIRLIFVGPRAFVLALIPVVLYFLFLWIKNNFPRSTVHATPPNQ